MTDDIATTERQSSIRLKRQVLCAFVMWGLITAVTLAALTPLISMSGFVLVPLGYLAAASRLYIIFRRLFSNDVMRFVGAFAAFVISGVLFISEINFLIWYWHEYPPTRPMFSNIYSDHERALLPFWHHEWPMMDESGNLVLADHDDNVLVAVINGAPGKSWAGSYQITGQDEAQFSVRGSVPKGAVTIERTKNELIVIAQDQAIGRFPLQPDVAREFHRRS
jgi:hypothetical protein